MAPPWADSGGPNPSVILTTFIHVLRQNDTNCHTNAGVTRASIVTGPRGGSIFLTNLSILAPGGHKTMLFLWKTFTWATWPPHEATLAVQILR